MRVFVLNMRGKPLMPTTPRKARVLLKAGKARVVKRTPFMIQLKYATGEAKQEITLGVDAGSKTVGISATTDSEELYASESELRNDIVDLLSTRREFRKARRNRKTRYRQARFDNRKKKKGWTAPSIRHKIDSHIKIIADIQKILPIAKIIVEVASFDIQKIKNPDISGAGYQQGEQLDFWNVREYVLFRDGHKCQGRRNCGNKILNVHHIESRKTGGDAPNNLITLCEDCHNDYHAGNLKLSLKRGQTFKDTAFMGMMRWAFYNKLKEIYDNVSVTYGYITKNTRIQNGLPKSHTTDARCISGNPTAKPSGVIYFQKFVRKRNRQIHKATINKGGTRKLNQSPRYVYGFQLFDKVRLGNAEGYIFGRRASGYFDIRTLNGTKLSAGVSYKKLKLLEKRNSILTERRKA
jgi:N6-L-threonylcarbamoyladenine synthase